MTFIADESVDFPIILSLRNHGFDVRSVLEEFPSAADEIVLNEARNDDRILLTLDKDFGELVFRLKLLHSGVVLIRLGGLTSLQKAELVLRAIQEKQNEMANSFTVVQQGMTRIRKNG